MQKTTLTIIPLILMIMLICPVSSFAAGAVAARVNGEEISIAEVDMAVKAQPQYRELQSFVLKNIIVAELLYQESKKKGIKVDPKEVEAGFKEYQSLFPDTATLEQEMKRFNFTKEQLLNEITEKLMVKRFLETRAEKLKIDVTDKEVKAYYDAQPDKFNLPERIKVSHILLQCGPAEPAEKADKIKKQLIEIRKRIVAGEYFEDLAKEYSDDPSRTKGGNLGFITRQTTPDKDFAEAAFGLNVGEISGPVKTIYGFHLIKVTEKKAAMKISYEEIKGRIKDELLKQKNDSALNDYVKTLTEKSTIEVLLNKK